MADPQTIRPGHGVAARMNSWAGRLEKHNARVRAGDQEAASLSLLGMSIAAAVTVGVGVVGIRMTELQTTLPKHRQTFAPSPSVHRRGGDAG